MPQPTTRTFMSYLFCYDETLRLVAGSNGSAAFCGTSSRLAGVRFLESRRGNSTIDDEIAAGDPAGCGAGKKYYRLGNIVWPGSSSTAPDSLRNALGPEAGSKIVKDRGIHRTGT